ncbi:MAG: hypothetical protein WBY71_12280 [Nitrososphaeraceae archaeon]|jgi:hypothetical protein
MATMQTDGFNIASAIPMDNLSAGNNSDMTNPGWIDVTKYSEFQVLMLFAPRTGDTYFSIHGCNSSFLRT